MNMNMKLPYLAYPNGPPVQSEIDFIVLPRFKCFVTFLRFTFSTFLFILNVLADRTNGRAYVASVCDVMYFS